MNTLRHLVLVAGLLALFGAAALTARGQAAPQANPFQFIQSPPAEVLAAPALVRPARFRPVQVDLAALRDLLKDAPLEFTRAADHPVALRLPYPDGSFVRFDVVQSPIMDDDLAAKLPGMRTYSGRGVDQPGWLRFDICDTGFRAQVIRCGEQGAVYIDPLSIGDSVHHAVYFDADFAPDRPFEFNCRSVDQPAVFADLPAAESTARIIRRFRLAVASTGELTQFLGGVAATQTGIVSAVNRLNNVYENELSIRLLLVNSTALIFTSPATDPFNNTDQNQILNAANAAFNSALGAGNFDVGHVLTLADSGYASGGLANRPSACFIATSASGTCSVPQYNPNISDPRFDRVFAHEIGHQFNAGHSWNGVAGDCMPSQYAAGSAFEPGSGSTIMSYAGACGVDNVISTLVPDNNFNQGAINEIATYAAAQTCPVLISTGAVLPAVSAGPNRVIPARTPFTLAGVAAAGAMSYSWEQRSLGVRLSLANGDNGQSPIIRVRPPVSVPTRTIPQWSDLLNHTSSRGEILPTVARAIGFRYTVRFIGGGTASDDAVVTVVNTGRPFAVLGPSGPDVRGGNTLITWDPAGTAAAPISCANVRILLSTDGGQTFPTVLATSTPNDGSELVTLPSISSLSARVMIEAVNNIFFAVSDADFQIVPCPVATVITQNPAPVTTCSARPVSFSVTADGSGVLSYQWRRNGVNIPGATAATYSIASVVAANAGNYDCVVAGGCTTATSSPALLTVFGSLAITTQPVAAAVCAGATATFRVVATGTAPVTYQWMRDSVDIPGATTSVLTITGVSPASIAQYSVRVSNPTCGSVTSNQVPLTINAPVSIIVQPLPVTACPSSPVVFTVTGAGAGPLRYQWRRNNINISGATGASFSIPAVTTAYAGSYSCVVTGACGSVTSSAATLTVNAATVITTQPVARTVCPGVPATFSIAATGTPPLTYQWRKAGVPIQGETNPTLTIASPIAADAGSYTCAVTGGCGVAKVSAAAVLTVSAPTLITRQPAALTLCPGRPATFSIAATGAGVLRYQWRKDGVNIPGAVGAAYSIAAVSAASIADYSCIVTGGCGPVTSDPAHLTVTAPTAFTLQPVAVTTCPGQSVSFIVQATGTGTLTYQWWRGSAPIAGATASTYTIPSVIAGNAGSYTCVVTGGCGALRSAAAALVVRVPVAITRQPAPITACAGARVVLSVAATGTAPLTYQWQKDTVDIPGATAATLVIPAASAGDAGSYTVSVTSACGTVPSNPATLTVNPLTVITSQPVAANVCIGSPAVFTVTATGSGTLRYQWRRNGVNITGATGSSYTIASASSVHTATYTVVVTGACAPSVLSGPAILTVNQCRPGSTEPLACNIADIVSIGGSPPPDGQLTPEDFLAFVSAFAVGDPLADIAGPGQPPAPPDGKVNADDFAAFMSAFAAGCP